MIPTPVFWLILFCGTLWTSRASSRWRETGLAALAVSLVAWFSPMTCVGFIGLTVLTWTLLTRVGPRTHFIAAIVLGAGLAAAKLLLASAGSGALTVMGLSYLVFRLMHLLFEAARGNPPPHHDFAEFVHYAFSPAMFAAGPLQRWDEFCRDRIDILDRATAAVAVQRIIIGIGKKIVLADVVAVRLSTLVGMPPDRPIADNLPVPVLWVGCTLYYLRIYAEFSGYSDIAIGAGLLWGHRLMENFNWPIVAASPPDFWRRWHISLSRWCASYVYMPMLGAVRSTYLPLFASFLVMGLWHMVGWNRVGWAVWQTAGVLAHARWVRWMGPARAGTFRQRTGWRFASIALTQVFIIASYAFAVRGEDTPLQSSLAILRRLFGF